MHFFRRLLFSYVTPLIRVGRTRTLMADDMPKLDPDLAPRSVEQAFAGIHTESTLRFIISSFLAAGASARLSLALDIVRLLPVLAGPLLLRDLLRLVNSIHAHPEHTQSAVICALTLSAVVIADGVLIQHYYFNALKTWGRITNGLNMRVFRVALRLKRESQMSMHTGDVVNHMAGDCEGMAEASFFVPEIIQSCIHVSASIILLASLLGPASLAALGTLMVMLPLTRLAANTHGHQSD
jgi:hypothetical protein